MDGYYQISTQALLDRHASQESSQKMHDDAATELVRKVRSGEITFPFQQLFRPEPQILFQNLQATDLEVGHPKSYRLYSYYPTYGSYLPPLFRGAPATIHIPPGLYVKVDALSDLFIEDVRLQAKRYDQEFSVLECWGNDECLHTFMLKALEIPEINPESLRRVIYENYAETKVFNPTWAKALIKTVMGPNVAGKKWLDISAGWGDRMLTAMALGMDYVGFDPNIELKPGHTRMIQMFGDPNHQTIIYEPFETAAIPPGPYDVIQTSPPYFDVETYVSDQPGQSITTYPDFEQWMVWFLFASLTKAWDNLKPGGHLILHFGDTKTRFMCEATNIYIENFLPGASWEGIIGVSSETGFSRPVWVWQKVLHRAQQKFWEPKPKQRALKGQSPPLAFKDRTMFNTYPDLQVEIIKYLANRSAPDYGTRRQNARTIRAYVVANVPTIDLQIVDYVLSDTLLISSLLETKSVTETIQSLTDLVKRIEFAGVKRDALIMEFTHQVGDPNYWIRRENGTIIRQNLGVAFPAIPSDAIDLLFADDLMLSSVLEQVGIEATMKWANQMILITFQQTQYQDVTPRALLVCVDASGMLEIPIGDLNRAQIFGDPVPMVVKHIKIVIRGEASIYHQWDPCSINTTGLDLTSIEIPGRNDKWWPQMEAADSCSQKLDIIHQNIHFIGGSIKDEYPEQLMAVTFIKPEMKVLEIGSNIGRNTLTIASILADQSNLVTLECDPDSCRLLEVNRRVNRYNFKIENAALSYRKLIQRDWNTIPSDEVLPGYKPVATITFQELQAKHQIQFDTVVADCEGALYWILLDYPQLFQHINMLIVENDYGDLTHKRTVDAVVQAAGLKRVYSEPGPWGPSADCFYEVWQR